ncbi:transient receptor potential cation channel subfamily A member 1 homolog isoform X2 [Procambarus clarkii]|uniref:transient receptor potential cation channel subfamily A member 1 homolog isoform X2 n=1 Tax=Procambarus clarkii TaxID=6728 RepID=UPI003741F9B4
MDNQAEENEEQTLLDTSKKDHVVLSMEEESEHATSTTERPSKLPTIVVAPKSTQQQQPSKRLSQQQEVRAINKIKIHEAAEVGDEGLLQKIVNRQPKALGFLDKNGNTPLHLAAKGNHHDCCRILLEVSTKEVNINNKVGNSSLLLSIATGNKSTELTKLLINKGSKLDTKNKGKQTALHITSEKGNVETLKLLLELDKSCINAKDSEKLTPLHVAAKNGHWKACSELVKAGANLEDKDASGLTPLHWAAKMGFSECCKKLLEHKASINNKNNKGNTPLHLLCASGKEKPECAKLLIDHGADVNVQNNVGETPFHLSFRSHFKVSEVFLGQDVNLLLTDKQGRTVLHFAAERQNSDYVELVMKMEGSSKDLINKLDNQGKTALHIAISKKVIDTCKFLIRTGADGTISCGKVGTALHMAARYGLDDICDYLITKGVKVDIKNSEGLAPLHIAAKEGHKECCKVLCKRGAFVAIRDGDEMTALHHAAKGKHYACCEILKRQLYLVNLVDKHKRTPLHVAVEVNSLDCCKVLLTPKTDVWAKSFSGSPVKLACDGRYHDIFRLLLSYGSVNRTRNEKDINFQDLLEKSLERQDRKMVESIIDSCFWEEAFMPSQEILVEKQRNGNLRLLVKNYPDLVKSVLDKCIPAPAVTECDKTLQKPQRRYLVHYLDEAYPVPGKEESDDTKQTRPQDSQPRQPFETECGGLAAGAIVAPVDQAWRSDHLMEWILQYNHHHLLQHPLITYWLRYKWLSYIRIHHYVYLTLAFLLALLLTIFTAISWDWAYMEHTYNLTRSLVCPPGDEQLVGPVVKELLRQEGKIPHVLGYIILFMCSTRILYGIYKIIKLRKRCIQFEGLCSLISDTFSFIFITNFTTCSRNTLLREDWQWQVGVVSVLTSWLCVVMLMKNERCCSNFFYHTIHLFRTLFKIILPLLAIGTVVFFIYKISGKGKTANNQALNTFLQIFSNQWVSTAFFVGLTIVVCLVMLDNSRNQQRKVNKDLRTLASVKMTMDFDLLYPILRKKYYAFWIPEHKVNFSSQCNCLKQYLPCQKEQLEELSETKSENEREVLDETRDINKKIEKLHQNATEQKIATQLLAQNVNELKNLLKNKKLI